MPYGSRFIYKLAEIDNRALVHSWLAQGHVAEWFYGQGLQNTIKHLDEFFQQSSSFQYWLAYDKHHPFAFFITSPVSQSNDELAHWCSSKGKVITLDMFIGDTAYLGKGLSSYLIIDFLESQFPGLEEVLIDPEKTNLRAVYVYQKAGFKIIDEFVPAYSPNLHYMMRLNMKELSPFIHHTL